jgi:hypothetical protein
VTKGTNARSANPTVYDWQYLTEYDQYNNYCEGFLFKQSRFSRNYVAITVASGIAL